MNFSITEFDSKIGFFDIELLNLSYSYEPGQAGDLFTEHLSESFEFYCNASILEYVGDDCNIIEVKCPDRINEVKELALKSYHNELVEFVKSFR